MTKAGPGDTTSAPAEGAPGGAALDDPVLNGPYDPPLRHFEIGDHGPTGAIKQGRRPSESFVPVAPTRKKHPDGAQQGGQLELTLHTHEAVEHNALIGDLRIEVSRWRTAGYEGVTAITRKLLRHWADPHRDNRVLFAQREAAETAIFLAEVAGRHAGYKQWRGRIAHQNDIHNDGLPRVALKLATGSGKTGRW